MQQDALIRIMMTQLKETSNMRESSSQFVRRIVNIYTLHLLEKGNIPTQFIDEIMSDVEAEVVEMYRKKTYGYLTLEEYHRHRLRSKEDN